MVKLLQTKWLFPYFLPLQIVVHKIGKNKIGLNNPPYGIHLKKKFSLAKLTRKGKCSKLEIINSILFLLDIWLSFTLDMWLFLFVLRYKKKTKKYPHLFSPYKSYFCKSLLYQNFYISCLVYSRFMFVQKMNSMGQEVM